MHRLLVLERPDRGSRQTGNAPTGVRPERAGRPEVAAAPPAMAVASLRERT